MRYYLDTEFNEFGGDLISLALVRDDGESLYLVYPDLEEYGPWVKDNVVPILWSIPSPLTGMAYKLEDHGEGAYRIQEFLHGDPHPVILTDWPDDIRYFCQAIITGPGMMINTGPSIVFQMVRVDAYPTTLEGAVQHNAWWDAMALRELLK
jgi:hypothetical protein